MAPKDPSKPPEPNEESKRALGQAVPLIYAELRRLAAHYMGQERGYHTLQSTALVHEAYLPLTRLEPVHFENLAHFVELRVLGGLTIEETAQALKISPATVKREWATARLWLHHQMSGKALESRR